MQVHLKAWSAWAPGLSSPQDWAEWAADRKPIQPGGEAPALGHLPALFKRRLSLLSRMVLHVGHELCPGPREVKTVFASEYGEISQQLKLTASLLDSGEVAPAVFSLSVFNAPVALLSMAEKNTDRLIALNAGPASFAVGLWDALALLRRSGDPEVLLLAADEAIPAPFDELAPANHVPYALGLLLGSAPAEGTLSLEMEMETDGPPGGPAEGAAPPPPSALRFLRWLLGGRREALRLGPAGHTLALR
jgi:hypothetical protein